VQIYELGEHEGVPFFTLEYCEGGSPAQRLKDREDAPTPAKEAAALIETLAQAIDLAHQRNIVHRDLTPGNILFAFDARSPTLSAAAVLLLIFGSVVASVLAAWAVKERDQAQINADNYQNERDMSPFGPMANDLSPRVKTRPSASGTSTPNRSS